MSNLFTFTKKELYEQIKTFKGVAVAAVLLVFGMTSPLLAKLMPEIFKSADLGVALQIPDPTYLDAYAQFFKNIGEMGLIVIMLVYAGAVVSETTRGTATLMLTKRLSHSAFVISKFLSAAIVWTASYAGSAALCTVYTIYLFPEGKPSNLLFSLFCMWLFGVITLAAALFASAVFKSYILSAVGTFAVWGLLLVTSALPKIKDYTPAFLSSDNLKLLNGACPPDKFQIPIILGILLTALLLTLACIIFRRREL
jgi:ABC-2 type transport system permease protein